MSKRLKAIEKVARSSGMPEKEVKKFMRLTKMTEKEREDFHKGFLELSLASLKKEIALKHSRVKESTKQ